jgi:hypothetical protein
MMFMATEIVLHDAVSYLEEGAKWEYEDAMPYWLSMFLHFEA